MKKYNKIKLSKENGKILSEDRYVCVYVAKMRTKWVILLKLEFIKKWIGEIRYMKNGRWMIKKRWKERDDEEEEEETLE